MLYPVYVVWCVIIVIQALVKLGKRREREREREREKRERERERERERRGGGRGRVGGRESDSVERGGKLFFVPAKGQRDTLITIEKDFSRIEVEVLLYHILKSRVFHMATFVIYLCISISFFFSY